jgi:hypothetical protein
MISIISFASSPSLMVLLAVPKAASVSDVSPASGRRHTAAPTKVPLYVTCKTPVKMPPAAPAAGKSDVRSSGATTT